MMFWKYNNIIRFKAIKLDKLFHTILLFCGLAFALSTKIKIMKQTIFTVLLIITGYCVSAQLKSGNLNVPAISQPVPNATATEKSATPQPQNIAPAPNPVPPIYSGAEVQAAETQRQLVFPPTTPSGTQPVQKEPLSPIESTNNLNPNRPQREEASRENPAVGNSRNTRKPTTIVRTTSTNLKELRNVNESNSVIFKDRNTMTDRSTIKTNSSVKKSKVESKVVSKKSKAVKKTI